MGDGFDWRVNFGFTMSKPELYQTEPELLASLQTRLNEINTQLDQKMQRWELLLAKSES